MPDRSSGMLKNIQQKQEFTLILEKNEFFSRQLKKESNSKIADPIIPTLFIQEAGLERPMREYYNSNRGHNILNTGAGAHSEAVAKIEAAAQS
jgi:heme oxygenase